MGEDELTDSEGDDGEDSDSLEASIPSSDEESHNSNEPEEANETQSTMEHVLAMVESGRHTDGSDFDHDAHEEEYFNECDNDFEDEIIGAVVTEIEPFYDNDDYKWINLLNIWFALRANGFPFESR